MKLIFGDTIILDYLFINYLNMYPNRTRLTPMNPCRRG